MKNLKMSTVITTIISVVAAVCILLLYLVASRSMMVTMRDTAVDNMQTNTRICWRPGRRLLRSMWIRRNNC